MFLPGVFDIFCQFDGKLLIEKLWEYRNFLEVLANIVELVVLSI